MRLALVTVVALALATVGALMALGAGGSSGRPTHIRVTVTRGRTRLTFVAEGGTLPVEPIGGAPSTPTAVRVWCIIYLRSDPNQPAERSPACVPAGQPGVHGVALLSCSPAEFVVFAIVRGRGEVQVRTGKRGSRAQRLGSLHYAGQTAVLWWYQEPRRVAGVTRVVAHLDGRHVVYSTVRAGNCGHPRGLVESGQKY